MVMAFQILCRAFSGGGSGELDNRKAAPSGATYYSGVCVVVGAPLAAPFPGRGKPCPYSSPVCQQNNPIYVMRPVKDLWNHLPDAAASPRAIDPKTRTFRAP